MITSGAKFWFAVSALALVATVVYFVASGGEEYGTLVLLAAVLAAGVPGITTVVLGDGLVGADQDGLATADGTTTSAAPATTGATSLAPPRSVLPAGWPALGALGVVVLIVGLAAGGALFYVGLGILAVVLVEWMVQGWAERATGDRAHNTSLRNRIMNPFEIPVLALIGIALVVVAFSRVLLALPKSGSTVVAIVVAVLIFGVAIGLNARPRVGPGLLTFVAVLGAVGLVGGGIVGAVAGEREFEEEETAGLEGEEATGEAEVTILAEGVQEFTPSEVRVPAGRPVTIRFQNAQEDQTHGLSIQLDGVVEADADALTTENLSGGESEDIELPALEAGEEYTFISTVHQDMEGRILVVEDAEAIEPEGDGPDTAEPSAGDEVEPITDEQSEDGDGGDGTSPDDLTESSTP